MDKNLIVKTIESYDRYADEMARKFDKIGPRVTDIKDAMLFSEKTNPRVLELGCANGRDATEILKYTNRYLGIDGSASLVSIAKKRFPGVEFKVSLFDELEFLPNSFDIVFDFASLFHYEKESLGKLLTNIADWLDDDGILLMAFKKGKYQKIISQSGFGERTQFLYEVQDIEDISKDNFDILKIDEQNLRGQEWLTIILQKR